MRKTLGLGIIAASLALGGSAFAGNLTGVGDASTADQSSVVGLSNAEGYNTFGRNRYTMPYGEGAYYGAYGVPYYSGRSVYRDGAYLPPSEYLPD